MATTTTSSSQPGHNVVIVTAVELIGILIMYAVAENERVGKAIAVFMWAVLLGWLLANYSTLSTWVNKA